MSTAGARRDLERSRARIEGPPRRAMPTVFEAEYRTEECAECFEEILPGQMVHYRDGELVHHRHERPARLVVVCESCWCQKPCFCE